MPIKSSTKMTNLLSNRFLNFQFGIVLGKTVKVAALALEEIKVGSSLAGLESDALSSL